MEIDNVEAWDIEVGIDWVHKKFSELKTERRHKMEAIEK